MTTIFNHWNWVVISVTQNDKFNDATINHSYNLKILNLVNSKKVDSYISFLGED